MKTQMNTQVQALNLTINNLQVSNQNLQYEVLDLNNLIKSKDLEIASFKPMLSELSILKANIALKKLEDKTKEHSKHDLSHKLKYSNQMDQILELQNLLEDALAEKEILA